MSGEEGSQQPGDNSQPRTPTVRIRHFHASTLTTVSTTTTPRARDPSAHTNPTAANATSPSTPLQPKRLVRKEKLSATDDFDRCSARSFHRDYMGQSTSSTTCSGLRRSRSSLPRRREEVDRRCQLRSQSTEETIRTIDSVHQSSARLREMFAEAETELCALKQRNAELRGKAETSQHLKKNFEDFIARTVSTVTTFCNPSILAENAERESAVNLAKGLNATIRQLRGQIQEMSAEAVRLDSSLEQQRSLQKQKQTLADQEHHQRAENIRLQREMQEIVEDLSTLDNERKQEDKRRAQLKNSRIQLEATTQSNEDDVKMSRENLSKLQQSFLRLNRMAETNKSDLQSTISGLETRLKDLEVERRNIETSEKTINEEKTKMAIVLNEILQKYKLNNAHTFRTDLCSSADQIVAAVIGDIFLPQRNENDNRRMENERLLKQQSIAAKEIEDLEHKLKNIESDARHQLQEVDRHRTSVEKDLEATKKQIEDLEQQMVTVTQNSARIMEQKIFIAETHEKSKREILADISDAEELCNKERLQLKAQQAEFDERRRQWLEEITRRENEVKASKAHLASLQKSIANQESNLEEAMKSKLSAEDELARRRWKSDSEAKKQKDEQDRLDAQMREIEEQLGIVDCEGGIAKMNEVERHLNDLTNQTKKLKEDFDQLEEQTNLIWAETNEIEQDLAKCKVLCQNLKSRDARSQATFDDFQRKLEALRVHRHEEGAKQRGEEFNQRCQALQTMQEYLEENCRQKEDDKQRLETELSEVRDVDRILEQKVMDGKRDFEELENQRKATENRCARKQTQIENAQMQSTLLQKVEASRIHTHMELHKNA